MIKKYVKKPIVVKAVQWTGDNLNEIREFCNCDCHNDCYVDATDKIIIYTLKGDVTAFSGDYIINDVNGESYPCKPDIFKETYEEVYKDE